MHAYFSPQFGIGLYLGCMPSFVLDIPVGMRVVVDSSGNYVLDENGNFTLSY